MAMKVFVIMQFDTEMDEVYHDLIKSPLQNSGYT